MKKQQVSVERPHLLQSDIDFVRAKIKDQFDHPDLLISDAELIAMANRLGFDDLAEEMKNSVRPGKGWKIHRNQHK